MPASTADYEAALLHEQYENLEKQEHAGKLAMWSFLGSEALLFAGLFALYACYRVMYHAEFLDAADHNTLWYGSINTVVLITSSLTVALSIHYIRKGKRKVSFGLLMATLGFGCGFLTIKGFEYAKHFQEGIYPGRYFRDPELMTHGAKLFYTIYYFTTILHALHVMIGMGVLIWASRRVWRGKYTPEHYLGLELAGLYWHLVDLIWIFLWPLLYIAR